jgi:hypothetical protein
MHQRPSPDWYRVHRSGEHIRVLTDDGFAVPALNDPGLTALATLAAAIHLNARNLSEAELRQLEGFLALQRWTRTDQ